MADIEVRAGGVTVSASTADRVVIRLPENASTGYQWSITEVGDLLDVESNELLLPEELAPGAAGERVVVVRPRSPGRARVALRLEREWEPEPIERFEIEVDVAS